MNVLNKYVLTVLILDDLCICNRFDFRRSLYILTVSVLGNRCIFSPFYRATLARERESGGVGLGLSIAKAAVELHHGRIIAEPAERGGLRVTMSFPKL